MQEQGRNLVKLIIPRNEAKQRIEHQCSELQKMFQVKPKNSSQLDKQIIEFHLWRQYTCEMLRRCFSNNELANEFNSVPQPKITVRLSLSEKRDRLLAYAQAVHMHLSSILNKMDLYPESQADLQMDTRAGSINLVERLAINFPRFISQLAERQRGRKPISISDEYDLQDFFHALLKLFFDDVRREEWTPSYAGTSARMDFLLKSQQIIVELKETSARLRQKKVGEELIIDIAHYAEHQDCRAIVCFVYDPDHRITNPVGLENDLSRLRDTIDVKVIVSPQ